MNQDQVIGGVGKTVEIDESAFGKRKYNRGSLRETHWIFGGIERGINKIFAVPVPNRKRGTFWPIIFKYIAPLGFKLVNCGV
jgi:hypothetical protein